MKALRIPIMALGILAVAMGLLWIGQGLGLVMWPASSFMLAERQWAVYGAILALIGSGVVLLGRRIR